MIPKDKLAELKDVAQRADDPENPWGFAFAIEYINKCDPALILSMIAEIEKMQKADEIAECTSASLYGLYAEAHARAERIEKEADWLATELEKRVHGCEWCSEIVCSRYYSSCGYHGPDNWREAARRAVEEQCKSN